MEERRLHCGVRDDETLLWTCGAAKWTRLDRGCENTSSEVSASLCSRFSAVETSCGFKVRVTNGAHRVAQLRSEEGSRSRSSGFAGAN